MRVALLLAAAAALSLSAAACSGGGDDDDDGGGFSDDGGTGTGTLRIVAALSVDPDGNFLANVNVADAQSTVVNGATVTLKTPDQGDIVLVEQPVGFGTYVLPTGDYDYSSGYGLDVDGGSDGNAFGIGFDAPDATAVTSPQNQDTVPLSQDLTVTWAGRGADEHRLELIVNDYDSGWVGGDTGSDVIVAAVIGTAATETLTVRRRREIDITSGTQNSVFSVELEDVIEPLGVQ